MAEGKNSFVLYKDLIHVVEKLPADIAGELFLHILQYVNDQDPKTDNIIVNIAFEPVKQALKRDLRKWEKYIEKQKVNGAKGGRPKTQEKPKKPKPFFENPLEAKKADSVSVSVSDSVSTNVDNKVTSTYSASVPNAADVYVTKKKRKLSGKRLEAFNLFWEKFNYRKGKAEAADAFMDIPALTNSICNQIFYAAELEAKRRPELELDGKTPKMAQGWLTGRRWEDEEYSKKLAPTNQQQPYKPAKW